MVPFGRGAVGGLSALWRSLGLLQEPVRLVPFYMSCLVFPLTHSLHQRGFNWEQIFVENRDMFCKYRCVRSPFPFSIRSLSGRSADLSALLQRCYNRVVWTASAGGLGVAL